MITETELCFVDVSRIGVPILPFIGARVSYQFTDFLRAGVGVDSLLLMIFYPYLNIEVFPYPLLGLECKAGLMTLPVYEGYYGRDYEYGIILDLKAFLDLKVLRVGVGYKSAFVEGEGWEHTPNILFSAVFSKMLH